MLNYSHGTWLLLLPVILTIGSKYLLTVGGRHLFNPSMFGVAVSLLVSRELITAAPAYQWAGSSVTMSAFIPMAALSLFVFRVGPGALIVAFLVTYALQTALRAWIMRHHLPPEVLFIGTLSAPPFFIFSFYMITDPATSPAGRRPQIVLGIWLALVDLWLHTKESVYTFFYAALLIGTGRFLFLHACRLYREGPLAYVPSAFEPRRLRAYASVGPLAVATGLGLQASQRADNYDPGFRMELLSPDATGVVGRDCSLLAEVDPSVQHVAKWVLSVGDAVSIADVDRDGRMDLFVTNLLKRPEDRNALYRNLGDFRFERVPMPQLERHLFRWETAEGLQRELREAGTLTGFGGQSDPRLHVGLGQPTSDVEAEIHWYGGTVERRRLAPRAYHVVRQGQP